MISFRLKRLVEKLLSFKFAMFVIATALRILGFIGNSEWLTIALVVIGGHVGMKTFYKVREGVCERPASFNSCENNDFSEGFYNNVNEKARLRREEVSRNIINTPADDIAAGYQSVRGAVDRGLERFRERCQQGNQQF